MAEVILKNISKKYGPITAVTDFNLTVKDKEFCVLVGPSGCGKTTILRSVAGLEKVTTGDILIDNVRVNDMEPKERNIAMVFQNFALYPHMTAAENIGFNLKIKKVPKKEIKQRVMQAAEILNMTELLDRKPKHLSGGEKQRVAIGRAIVRNPKVFLFDEPLSNLDVRLRDDLRTEIKRLHERLHATIIYVTHEQTEAMILGDRICVMKPVKQPGDETMQQVDTPTNLYNTPATRYVAEFIGYPKMNILELTVIKENGKLILTDMDRIKLVPEQTLTTLIAPYTGKKLVFGIRPENVRMSTQNADNNTVHATVDITAPVGSDVYVHAKVNDNMFVLKTSTDTYVPVKPDQQIILSLNMDKIHLFDPVTTKSITKS
jgi:multiple sugar transport system ATP-binding protein